MSLKIIQPGLLTTLQDNGRYGYQKIGVITSGAMDVYSLRLANILVGNDENEAALEITLMGPVIEFTDRIYGRCAYRRYGRRFHPDD